ncbi:MAG: entericidin A/B family lipoprotein [Pseudomonadota bacterium]
MTALFKPLRLIAALLLVAGTVAACDNTIRGVGQDVQDTGEAIEDAATQ